MDIEAKTSEAHLMLIPPNNTDPNAWYNYNEMRRMQSDLDSMKANANSFTPPIYNPPPSSNVVIQEPSPFEIKMVEEHFGWYVVWRIVQSVIFILFVLLLLYTFMPADVVPSFHAEGLFKFLDSTFIGGFRVWGQKLFENIQAVELPKDPTANALTPIQWVGYIS